MRRSTDCRPPKHRVSPAPSAVAATLTSLSLAVTACATTGATLGSGVGDTWVDHPPYYAGQPTSRAAPSGDLVGHLPVTYQRGASQAPVFDPTHSPDMARLLADMTAFLDGLGASTPLVDGERVSAVAHRDTRFPPDVRFGCETATGAPGDDCLERGDSALGRGPQWMALSVGRPSTEWTAWIGSVMSDQGIDRALVITLEVGHYWTRQRGFRGTKIVELGTGHTQELPWLTSLETPVAVVQLTGALVTPDGKAVRIGAEGLFARRTGLLLSAVGAQELISDQDIAWLVTARREDLPGKPRIWEAGLRALVEQLTGHPVGRLARVD